MRPNHGASNGVTPAADLIGHVERALGGSSAPAERLRRAAAAFQHAVIGRLMPSCARSMDITLKVPAAVPGCRSGYADIAKSRFKSI